ncbi:MAG: hypothetical protein EHM36_15875, partial [Deltaproteobacteria bacterium]
MPAPITTEMTYDSLSKKISMTDPAMGHWTYDYHKSGHLWHQTDAMNQTIEFTYDEINRPKEKIYPNGHKVRYFYDDPTVAYSLGKLTKMDVYAPGQEVREDTVLQYDVMQRVKKSKKKIGAEEVTFESGYDTAGRVISQRYVSGTTTTGIYGYGHDVAGNFLYIKDKSSGMSVVWHSDFTALGQPRSATSPRLNNASVKTTYTYYPDTGRLHTLLTQKMSGSTPVATYQNLNYSLYDGTGNIRTLNDIQNGIDHTYTYDNLDRLRTAQGSGFNSYNEEYTYDVIG